MTDSNDLSGKIALVTGSSTGIGAAIATEMARLGAAVILHGRSPSIELEQTAAGIVAKGGHADCLCCDYSDTRSIEPFAESAWNVHQKLDIVVNNAGGDVLTGELAGQQPLEKLDYLYTVDCRSTFLLSRILGSKMKYLSGTSGQRSIVNIGWDQALQGMAGDSGQYFSAIKGSVMSLTLSLAQSLAPEVRVNCVAPGWIQTQWGDQTSDYWNNRARSESLMNRWGTPQDVANAVTFLASDLAGFVSGQILNVNGGYRYDQSDKT